MTRQELTDAVWKLIDENNMGMSQTDYRDFLEELADEANTRANAAEHDIWVTEEEAMENREEEES